MSLEQHQIEKYKLDEWFFEDYQNKIIKIRFTDRIESKFNGEYHNIFDAAILYHKNTGTNQYYINGKHYKDKVDWEKDALKLARRSKIRDIFKED
jgi:hypothetical protein